MKNPNHRWAFRPRFRANAFGWKSSKLASQRLKEARIEIRAGDVWEARRYALETAEATGQLEVIQAFLTKLIASADTDAFVRRHLEAPYGVRHPAAGP